MTPHRGRDWQAAWAQRWTHSNHRHMSPTRRSAPQPVFEAFPPSEHRRPRAMVLLGIAAAAALILWSLR